MMINSDVVRRQKTAKPIYKAENVPPAGVKPNSDPCQIITPLVLIGLGVCVCVCVGGGVRQSDSDFNERGDNMSRGRKWAQHRNLLKCVVFYHQFVQESMSPVTRK